MGTNVQRTQKSGSKSLFFQDLASPLATHRDKFSTPGQAAVVSALRRENFGGSDPPPPPFFTLEDRVDFSPESGISDYPLSSDTKSSDINRTPLRDYYGSGKDSVTPMKSRFEASPSFTAAQQQTPQSSSWWSPGRSDGERNGGMDEDWGGLKGKGSPVEGVVKPVARPELPMNNFPVGNLDEEEWVTVYGCCSFIFSTIQANFIFFDQVYCCVKNGEITSVLCVFGCSKVVRLSIAQVLTVISQKQKSALRDAYKNKKFLPFGS
ncbi:hypothetical protein MKW94_009447 [Papaver nudicaule]|uniref:Uncharacterized protein n=1 Tax=Papaver nudicaule TaxID=74823 RepID=A0AA41VGU8_PAPNU|nr:hypothetical protein [Papaver nudicaule]